MRPLLPQLPLLLLLSPVAAAVAASPRPACDFTACYKTATDAPASLSSVGDGPWVDTGLGIRLALPQDPVERLGGGQWRAFRFSDGRSLGIQALRGGRLIARDVPMSFAELARLVFTRVPERLPAAVRESASAWQAFVALKRLFLTTAREIRHRRHDAFDVFVYRDGGTVGGDRLCAWVIGPRFPDRALKLDARGFDRTGFERVLASLVREDGVAGTPP